jgi:cell wall-associated NlpC family hydrolase
MKFYLLIIFILSLVLANDAEADYIVKKGDTLQKISKKFNVSVSELKRLNNLKSDRLVAGMRLKIKKEQNDKVVNSNKKSSRNIASKTKKSEPKTYTVKKGDTIWRIAKRFNMTVDDLKEINELQDNSIKVGQRLYLSKSVDRSTEEEIIKVLQTAYERKTEIEKLEVSSKEPVVEDLSTMGIKDRLVLFAKKMLNIPYKFGGNSFLGIDCSAYVQKVYSIAGIELPRTAREQFNEGIPVEKEELTIGDLVFFKTYASFPSHVGIYLGNNLFIHASSKSKKVTIDNLDTPYYAKRFIGAKRLLHSDNIDRVDFPLDKIYQ